MHRDANGGLSVVLKDWAENFSFKYGLDWMFYKYVQWSIGEKPAFQT